MSVQHGYGAFKAILTFLVVTFIGTILWIIITPVTETVMTTVNSTFDISAAARGVFVLVHNIWLWFPILFLFAGFLSLLVYMQTPGGGGGQY